MLNSFFYLYARIFAKICFLKFNKLLYHLSLRGLGIYNCRDMKISGEINFIRKYISSNDDSEKILVFDVGANLGEYTKHIMQEAKNVKVYCFEPNPKTFEKLTSNLKGPDIKLFNYALSDSESTLQLYDYEANGSSSHASLNADVFKTVHEADTTSYDVEVLTVDAIIANEDLAKIDFLKIDVEGYELNVLQGAKKAIAERKINIIQFEFTQLNTTAGVFFKDFYDLLSENYKIYRLLPNELLEIKKYDPTLHEIFGYQNFVAFLKR